MKSARLEMSAELQVLGLRIKTAVGEHFMALQPLEYVKKQILLRFGVA